jgi:RNA polymerase sigma-70 factor (ECF subfamily)
VVPSFEDAFRAEFPALHRFLHRRVGRAAADDLAAETFARAYACWSRFDPARPLRPWLYGIAANVMRHEWRRERRQLRAYAKTGVDSALDELPAAIGRADAASRTRCLAAALAELRPADREILLLHAWAELTDLEIAAALSLPVGTVKSRLHRTRAKLRNRLEASGQPADSPIHFAEGEPGR